MSHLIKWLKKSLDRPEITGAPDQPAAPDTESGEDISMPDINSEVKSVTVPMLRIIDKPSPKDDESAGFNPYDTGVLQEK